MRRFAILLVGLLVIVAVCLAIVVARFDGSRARPWIEKEASAALGRAVTIRGEISPKLSLRPTLSARDVQIRRSPDKAGPLLAEFARFEVKFPLLPLILQQRFELLDISASDGRLVIANESPGAEAASGAVDLSWLDSLPEALHFANLRIELGGDRKEPGDLLIERASAGGCGDRLEIEARRQEVTLSLEATLRCPGDSRLGLSGIEAKLGKSTLAGSLELDLGKARPRLSGKITKGDLRFQDLADLAPASGPKGPPLLDTELPLAPPGSPDVDLELAGTAVRLPWENVGSLAGLEGHLQLVDRSLDLQIRKATLLEGALTARLRAHGSSVRRRVTLDASIEKASIAGLYTGGRASGLLDGSVELVAHGNTPRALLAAAEGKASAMHGQVNFESPPLGPLGRDVLGILFAKKPSGQMRCLAVRTSLEDGLGPLAIVIDTPGTTVAGVGPLDLRKLSLHVVLRPRPHRASIATLKTPILVSGPIAAPRARLAKAALLKSAGETALFGALNPFLLAAPLVDLGTGGGNPCAHAIEAATVEALKRKGGLKKSADAMGKGGRWLEGFLRRKSE